MRLAIVCLIILSATGPALGQKVPGVVKASTVMATDAVHPGSVAKVVVVAQISPGFHINDHHPSLDYLIPTKVTFDASPALKAGKVIYPKGDLRKFMFLDSPISVYEGEIRIGTSVMVSRSLKPGTYSLRGKFSYQACNDHACLAPTSFPLEVVIHVVRDGVPVKSLHSEIFKQINFD